MGLSSVVTTSIVTAQEMLPLLPSLLLGSVCLPSSLSTQFTHFPVVQGRADTVQVYSSARHSTDIPTQVQGSDSHSQAILALINTADYQLDSDGVGERIRNTQKRVLTRNLGRVSKTVDSDFNYKSDKNKPTLLKNSFKIVNNLPSRRNELKSDRIDSQQKKHKTLRNRNIEKKSRKSQGQFKNSSQNHQQRIIETEQKKGGNNIQEISRTFSSQNENIKVALNDANVRNRNKEDLNASKTKLINRRSRNRNEGKRLRNTEHKKGSFREDENSNENSISKSRRVNNRKIQIKKQEIKKSRKPISNIPSKAITARKQQRSKSTPKASNSKETINGQYEVNQSKTKLLKIEKSRLRQATNGISRVQQNTDTKSTIPIVNRARSRSFNQSRQTLPSTSETDQRQQKDKESAQQRQ